MTHRLLKDFKNHFCFYRFSFFFLVNVKNIWCPTYRFVWVLCLMAYIHSWIIWCQIHLFRKTVVILFNPCWGDKVRGHTFPRVICPKVNIIARLEFELVYYELTVQYISHYTMGTPRPSVDRFIVISVLIDRFYFFN